ncbi:hypothetical protein AXF42_Ash019468 [Apostasia shenzhenica]|uniref:PB1 domain-containing protein n=1 Tax=Apostasia shenzhenica TaxID=1088818 RepID=A0A2I0AYG6_9ASPA|nr:hypothetical protein AXF42_Ash019468 [Apostasia shenzhenica]
MTRVHTCCSSRTLTSGMEGFPYSSFPESGDASPPLREVEADISAAWNETLSPSSGRVKLMCSYGGRIQPRPHGNQFSYVGGETKILTVDRSISFSAAVARLASLYGAASPEEICFKYQLPGEDLDALISVTNDEDLEQMMIEYDRLRRSSGKPAPRLRLFLFPTNLSNSSPAAAILTAEQKAARLWFVETDLPLQSASALNHNPPARVPDLLSGIVQHPSAVKVKDPTPEPLAVKPSPSDASPPRLDVGKRERPQATGEPVISPSAEVQRQIQEVQRLHLTENQHQPNPSSSRFNNGEQSSPHSSPVLALGATAHIPVTFWPDQCGIAGAGGHTSTTGMDQPFYLLPVSHGLFPSTAAAGNFTSAQPAATLMPLPRVVPAEVYCEKGILYAAAPPSPQPVNVVGSKFMEGSAALRQPGMDAGAAAGSYTDAAQMACGSRGRAMFYQGGVPLFQMVHNPEAKMGKPSHIS